MLQVPLEFGFHYHNTFLPLDFQLSQIPQQLYHFCPPERQIVNDCVKRGVGLSIISYRLILMLHKKLN